MQLDHGGPWSFTRCLDLRKAIPLIKDSSWNFDSVGFPLDFHHASMVVIKYQIERS